MATHITVNYIQRCTWKGQSASRAAVPITQPAETKTSEQRPELFSLRNKERHGDKKKKISSYLLLELQYRLDGQCNRPSDQRWEFPKSIFVDNLLAEVRVSAVPVRMHTMLV